MLRTATTPLFHPNSGVFPLDWIAYVVALRSEDPKLIIRVITFELVLTYMPTVVPQRYRQIDRQRDGRLMIAIRRFALHSKNLMTGGFSMKM